jgi:hypothetical protein
MFDGQISNETEKLFTYQEMSDQRGIYKSTDGDNSFRFVVLSQGFVLCCSCGTLAAPVPGWRSKMFVKTNEVFSWSIA